MPTYEYECKECDHHFEVFQSMSDEPIKICPECGKEVRRLIFGGVGVIFKGPGFYVTDRAAAKSSGSIKGKTDSAASTGDAPAKPSEAAADSTAATKDSEPKSGTDQGKDTGADTKKKTKSAAKSA
jgi:putative FmdB family regulatory protein